MLIKEKSVSLRLKMPKYFFNPITLSYESRPVSKGVKYLRVTIMTIVALALVFLYVWLYTSVFKLELPKTAMLKHRHAQWEAKIDVLQRNLDAYERTLSGIEQRDDDVYRSIYGLSPLPEEIKQAGEEEYRIYEELNSQGANAELKELMIRMNIIFQRVYVRSKAFDELEVMVADAGDMISCVPSVPPIIPDYSNFRISSAFGYRIDPVYGGRRMHQGMDFSMAIGNPVFSTGDGVVEEINFNFRGYGNEIVIDHGYGYKTRYAHLNTVEVTEGMEVKRGEKIGTVGNTGKSTAPHLHYEVMRMGAKVNPYNYMDVKMPVEEYKAMIDQVRDDLRKDKKLSTSELLKRGGLSDE